MLRITPRLAAQGLLSRVARGIDFAPLRDFYETHGYVVVPGVLDKDMRGRLTRWVEEVECDHAVEGKYMTQYEKTAAGETVPCRSEYIVNHHRQIRELIVPGAAADADGAFVPEIVSAVHGRDVRLYKEKVNYKYPFTGAYRAHQDITAYPNSTHHVTCLISLCDTDTVNGCLEFVSMAAADRAVLPHRDGVIDAEVVAKSAWTPVPTQFGDLVLFNSYVPHRSGANASDAPRKALYLTYNDAAEGDLREAYYASKRAALGEGKISLIDHYGGDVLKVKGPGPSRAAALPPKLTSRDAVIEEIRALFEGVGKERYDAHITQVEHALQTAAFARDAGEGEAFQLACFLHDVGHLLLNEHSGDGAFLERDRKHESVGYLYLKQYFPADVAAPALFHVLAKRYLCSVDPAYHASLSAASQRSFEVQGGRLPAADLARLEGNPKFAAAVRLRRYEDAGKAADRKDLGGVDYAYCEALMRKFITV
eukprot:TRINITY_DN3990_c0_g1_i1.p1 TRINITY_DN3990_c0_g1~~TRINITY_DN3990_c0_g1_i1.p1  ORF type:complete len:480 (+),score=172.67 TRINITY_DN3990_c0_g1_i1:69-1508(+)